jgi:hypothetical protein
MKPVRTMKGPFSVAGRSLGLELLRLALLCALIGLPAAAQAQDLASLQARHTALREQLASNPFQRPLVLESRESPGGLRGDIHARVDQPFAEASAALQGIDRWCDILILHLNVKRCQATPLKSGDTLRLNIGAKHDQPLADAYGFEFAYKVVAARPDYLQVVLNAEQGPLGTSRYRFVLEAMALDAGHSFLHLSYAYDFGTVARMAMQGYLATVGRAKVGFSIVGNNADGQPIYIGGTRGVVERNTMRYYLAIVAYLGALSTPAPKQLEKRLNDWHSAVEHYPIQLHELERGEYLAMKRREVQRQRAAGD